jgi:hypothetical protein
VIEVTPNARVGAREDRAGDPLDGLVNLFDLGIVLAVAFLLAALASLHLGDALTGHGLHPLKNVEIQPGQTIAPLPKLGPRTLGPGVRTGVVYRLADGQLVYVQNASRPRRGAR